LMEIDFHQMKFPNKLLTLERRQHWS
jgi:hypothetical protein